MKITEKQLRKLIRETWDESNKEFMSAEPGGGRFGPNDKIDYQKELENLKYQVAELTDKYMSLGLGTKVPVEEIIDDLGSLPLV